MPARSTIATCLTGPLDSVPAAEKSIDQTREFLSRVVPWPAANLSGYINLHYWTENPREPGKKNVTGEPFTTLDRFMNFVDRGQQQPSMKDMWFCTSLQSTDGKTRRNKAKAVRWHRNAVGLKAIWIDIDVKESQYASLEDARTALDRFCVDANLPPATALVQSGSGLHVYWISNSPLTPKAWRSYADGLRHLLVKHDLKCDAGLTTDNVRLLRVPGTLNYKTTPPKPVKLLRLLPTDYDFAGTPELSALTTLVPLTSPSQGALPSERFFDPVVFDKPNAAFAHLRPEPLSKRDKVNPFPVVRGCKFLQEALATGGKNYDNPRWNLTTLLSVFLEDGNALAHKMASGHKDYTHESTEALYQRKINDQRNKNIGYPKCSTIQAAGCGDCATCPFLSQGKSPLNITLDQDKLPAEVIFADPYSEFVGPEFPMDVLPVTLARYVDAEHHAMGADRSALAMAALTAASGAIHAETRVRMGESWYERPIFWTALVGQPSAMKSPIIAKATAPLSQIDHGEDTLWRQVHAKWVQNQKTDKTILAPPKPPRCVINDATAEKVAEILSRHPSGSLMIHDELAGWLSNFERYNSGSSRAFYLTSWNGGPHLKDRVGKGRLDADAEIRVENLAVGILGGIQPDRISKLGDLTSDGLLQRFLFVLMKSAERGDQDYPVAQEKAAYEKLIQALHGLPPQNYHFADDALEVRDRVLDYLHNLEKVDGFASALIGAVGKLKGYFARLCLVLHIVRESDTPTTMMPPLCTPAEAEHLRTVFKLPPDESLSAGITTSRGISRHTAEAAEKLIREFLLPHSFGFYDVVANRAQERDKLRAIGDFILSSNKTRLRPSDFTAGIRALRGEPEQKNREWVGRFCSMGWLQPIEDKPGVPVKAWQVSPGLREHFAQRRRQAEAARAKAHAILIAGGSRKAR